MCGVSSTSNSFHLYVVTIDEVSLVAAISGSNSETDSEVSANGLSTSDGVAACCCRVVEESSVNIVVLPSTVSVLLPLGISGDSLSCDASGIKCLPSDDTSVRSESRVSDASTSNFKVRSNVHGRGLSPASRRRTGLSRVRSNSDLNILAVAEAEIFLESFVRDGAGSFSVLFACFTSALVEGSPFSIVSSRDVPLNSACSVLSSGHFPCDFNTIQVSGGLGVNNSGCNPVGSEVLVGIDSNGRDKDVSSTEVTVAVHDVEGNESTPKEEHDDSREDSGNTGSTEFSSDDQASEAKDHEADDRGSQE